MKVYIKETGETGVLYISVPNQNKNLAEKFIAKVDGNLVYDVFTDMFVVYSQDQYRYFEKLCKKQEEILFRIEEAEKKHGPKKVYNSLSYAYVYLNDKDYNFNRYQEEAANILHNLLIQ